jgi:hypothetical protein
MTVAHKPQDPAKFRRYRERMKARGLKEVRLWVYDPAAPGFQEALDRQIDRINAAARLDGMGEFLDASTDDLLASIDAAEAEVEK